MGSSKKRRSSPAASAREDLPPCPEYTRRPGGPYPAEVRDYALLLMASGVTAKAAAARIGCCREILRVWKRRAEETGTFPELPVTPPPSTEEPAAPSMPQRAPKDPGAGLGAR